MRRLRVLVLMHPDFMPPESSDGYTEAQINEWKTEYDVCATLREMGHHVQPLGVWDDLGKIREAIEEWRKDYNEVRPQSALRCRTPQEFCHPGVGLRGGVWCAAGKCSARGNDQDHRNLQGDDMLYLAHRLSGNDGRDGRRRRSFLAADRCLCW